MAEKVVAIVQFPGMNCEMETRRALNQVGLDAEIFRWNRQADELSSFDAFVLPGGFSYEDRVRAGVVAAKEALFDVLSQEAERGKPVLGICNGAQILLESGLLPGIHPGQVEMALAHNYITYNHHVVRRGHHCGWVNLRTEVDADRSPFTGKLQSNECFPITVSHGEGRFTCSDPELVRLLHERNQILWRYCDDQGEIREGLPVNPNGSMENIAGICNPAGNVAALMPHPERAFYLRQVPSAWKGVWGEKRRAACGNPEQWNAPGPGYAIFESLADALKN
ncbi:MAG: phosphoribosylformylglycinamidine synthase I [bacterium]|jgi:phosphoribosylformylglycinamidine synthase I